jgi:citrate synthase
MRKTKTEQRHIDFTQKLKTKIWHETPKENNPYLSTSNRCHGYDLIDLIHNCSYIDVLFLLFIGELPSKSQHDLLEKLMVALINPGPRHPACRAVMNAAASKTKVQQLLPIGLSVLSGPFLGGEEVVNSMLFIRKNLKKDPTILAAELLESLSVQDEGDFHIVPGFGTRFGEIDPVPQKAFFILKETDGDLPILEWCGKFTKKLSMQNIGILTTGLAAAVFCELGFPHRAGAGLYQILCSPGILAHGVEFSNKPITAYPFLDDKHFIISKNAKKK